MFNINLQDHNQRQAELIQEAEKVRMIRSLKKSNSPTKGIAGKIQGLISSLILS
ncbi:MAG: hypothetical protein ACK2TZ_04920 [Anaerolineales bacterium]